MASRLCLAKLLHGFAALCKQQDSIQEVLSRAGPGLLMSITVHGRFTGFHCGERLSSAPSGARRSVLYWL